MARAASAVGAVDGVDGVDGVGEGVERIVAAVRHEQEGAVAGHSLSSSPCFLLISLFLCIYVFNIYVFMCSLLMHKPMLTPQWGRRRRRWRVHKHTTTHHTDTPTETDTFKHYLLPPPPPPHHTPQTNTSEWWVPRSTG